MNITKNNLDDLNAVITIEVKPEDYQQRVNNLVKQYQKTAKVPGFRPGHVPAGMIRKMFGKSLLVDELNKILGESLGRYIYENKLEVIGSPIPKSNESEQALIEGNSFSFDYEVGLAPSFEVKMPDEKIPYYLIKVDDKMIEDDTNDLRRRYGKFSNPEVSEESSVLYGEFVELDAEGNVKEGGNKTTTTLSIELIRDVQKRKKFVGLKQSEVIKFNPLETYGTETEVTSMLKVGKDDEAIRSDYNFTIMTINKVEKAELNQEFYDKVFGEGQVTTEEEFRDRIKQGVANYFERESDRKLRKDVRNKFLEINNLPLPDDFLKRTVKANQDKQIDDHEFDHQYFHIAEDLRWNLIQNKIASSQEINITDEDITEAARQMVIQQFAQYGVPAPEEEKLNEIAMDYLSKEDNADRIERGIKESKVFDYLKKTLSLNMIELPYEEFVAKLNEKTAHEAEHHH